MTRTERSSRHALLKKIVSTMQPTSLRAFYAARLREIELGKMKWSEDSQQIETAIITKYLLKSSKSRTQPSAIRKSENQNDKNEDNTWFCQPYQRNKCSQKTAHTELFKGRMKLAQQICATCWLKDIRSSGMLFKLPAFSSMT